MEKFIANGYYTVSNSGGYEVQLNESGDGARIKDGDKITDWFEIEWVADEEAYEDFVPVIDPTGYNIPLNLVMKI